MHSNNCTIFQWERSAAERHGGLSQRRAALPLRRQRAGPQRRLHGPGGRLGPRPAARSRLGEAAAEDLHSLVQLPPAEGRHADREHRRGLPRWPQADAAPGGDLRGAIAKTGAREDESAQNQQREQSARFHRQQRRQAGVHRG